jgi:hypothetical protein
MVLPLQLTTPQNSFNEPLRSKKILFALFSTAYSKGILAFCTKTECRLSSNT